MEAILFCGIQACGKSTFYRQRFVDSHVRINLDMLRTRHRESLLLETCIEGKIAFVVDNTNLTLVERARYIAPARAAGFSVVGYYFAADLKASIERNDARAEACRVPRLGLLGAHRRLQIPTPAEGFHSLHYVRNDAGGFIVEPWRESAEIVDGQTFSQEGRPNEVR